MSKEQDNCCEDIENEEQGGYSEDIENIGKATIEGHSRVSVNVQKIVSYGILNGKEYSWVHPRIVISNMTDTCLSTTIDFPACSKGMESLKPLADLIENACYS